MSKNWPQYMSETSDDVLSAYIRDHKKYLPEAAEAIIVESVKRDRALPADEIAEIRSNIQVVQEEQGRINAGLFLITILSFYSKQLFIIVTAVLTLAAMVTTKIYFGL